MAAMLGKYVVQRPHGDTEYECAFCYKTYTSLGALEQHCMNSNQHAWCHRCQRVFANDYTLEEHIEESPLHNFCYDCHPRADFMSIGELERHKTKEHYWCAPCNWYGADARNLRRHDLDMHYMCDECDRYFQNDNNRRMHKISHQPRDEECFGCYRRFPSFSAMLIHLESGTCGGGSDRDELYGLAFRCYQHKKYSVGNTCFPFFCPECDKDFSTLSGLYQHAETRIGCSRYLVEPRCLQKLSHFLAISV